MATRLGPLFAEFATYAVPGRAATTFVPQPALMVVPGLLPAVLRSCARRATAGKKTLGATVGRFSARVWAWAEVARRGTVSRVLARMPVIAPAMRFEIVTQGSM